MLLINFTDHNNYILIEKGMHSVLVSSLFVYPCIDYIHGEILQNWGVANV